MTSTFDHFNIFNDAGHRFVADATFYRAKAENAKQDQDQRTAARQLEIAKSLETEAETLFEMARRFQAGEAEPAWTYPTPLPESFLAAA